MITYLFTIESLIKIIALGFIKNGKQSYLRSPWNCLDFFIVIVSLLEMALQNVGNFSSLKTIRIVRVLRPIRLIVRSTSLRSSILSLVKSVPKILELLALVIMVLYMLANLETYLFSGEFNYCYVEHLPFSLRTYKKLIRTKWDCLNYGGEWILPDLNFDSVG